MTLAWFSCECVSSLSTVLFFLKQGFLILDKVLCFENHMFMKGQQKKEEKDKRGKANVPFMLQKPPKCVWK